MIGVFLAVLELTRQKRILVAQNESHDDIEILPAPEEHRRTYQEAMEADDKPTEGPEPKAEELVEEQEPAEEDGTSSIMDEVSKAMPEDEQEIE